MSGWIQAAMQQNTIFAPDINYEFACAKTIKLKNTGKNSTLIA